MRIIPPILYVEDSENDIEQTQAAFSQCKIGNRIDSARSGQEAIDYLDFQDQFSERPVENPVLIMLDLKMPKLDGIEVLKIIK